MQVDAAIHLIEQAAFAPSDFAEHFPQIATRLDARTFHMVHEPGTGPPTFIIASQDRAFLDTYLQQGWFEHDTWTQRCRLMQITHGRVLFTDSKTIPDHVRRNSAFFQDFYPAWDIAHVAAWCFKVGDYQMGFTIKRPKGLPFSESDVANLKLFKKAANRAATLVTLFHEQHVRGFVHGLEMSGRPSIVIDRQGKVSYVTASAEALMGDGFGIRQGVLRGSNPRSAAGFLALRKWIAGSEEILPAAFIIERLSGRQSIVAVPVAVPDNGLLELPFARIVLMLLDMDKNPRVPASILQAAFGLTSREAEVATLLASGVDLSAIAELLNLKQSSTRQLTKSIFAKTGARRQGELVAMLAKFA